MTAPAVASFSRESRVLTVAIRHAHQIGGGGPAFRADEARRKWAQSMIESVNDWRVNGFNHRVQAARQREQQLFNRFGVTRAALAALHDSSATTSSAITQMDNTKSTHPNTKPNVNNSIKKRGNGKEAPTNNDSKRLLNNGNGGDDEKLPSSGVRHHRDDDVAPLFASLVQQHMIADAARRGDVGRYGLYYPRDPPAPPLSTLDVIQSGYLKLSTHSGVSFTQSILNHVLSSIVGITLVDIWLFRGGRCALARVTYTLRDLPHALSFVDVVRNAVNGHASEPHLPLFDAPNGAVLDVDMMAALYNMLRHATVTLSSAQELKSEQQHQHHRPRLPVGMVPVNASSATPINNNEASSSSSCGSSVSRRRHAMPSRMVHGSGNSMIQYASSKLPSLEWPSNITNISSSSSSSAASSSVSPQPLASHPLSSVNVSVRDGDLNQFGSGFDATVGYLPSIDIHTRDPPLPRFSCPAHDINSSEGSIMPVALSARDTRRVSKRWRSRLNSSTSQHQQQTMQPQSARRSNDKHNTNNNNHITHDHTSSGAPSSARAASRSYSSTASMRRLHQLPNDDKHAPQTQATHWSLTSDTLVRL